MVPCCTMRYSVDLGAAGSATRVWLEVESEDAQKQKYYLDIQRQAT